MVSHIRKAVDQLLKGTQKLDHEKVIIVARFKDRPELKPIAHWLRRIETDAGFYFSLTADVRRGHTYYVGGAPRDLNEYVNRLKDTCDDLEILACQIVKFTHEFGVDYYFSMPMGEYDENSH